MAKVPADVDRPDRIVGGLTARQLFILGGDALVIWAAYSVVGRHVPMPVFVAFAVVVGAMGATWALAVPDGVTLETLAMTCIRDRIAGRRLVLAPEGLPDTSGHIRGGDPVRALSVPFKGVDGRGAVELGADGATQVCEASAVNLALRSEQERRALLGAFAKMLNGLDAPVQFVARSVRADLSAVAAEAERRSREFDHPALRRAARAHAQFLRQLGARADVLGRQVLICLRAPDIEGADALLTRRTAETASLARGMGVKVRSLEAAEMRRLLGLSLGLEPAAIPTESAVLTVRGRT